MLIKVITTIQIILGTIALVLCASDSVRHSIRHYTENKIEALTIMFSLLVLLVTLLKR